MKLLIAGGGTGGHIFSGLAVAEGWQQHGGEVAFVGTSRGMETKLVPQYGFLLKEITVSQLKGKSFFERVMTLLTLPLALLKSAKVLIKQSPDVVLGIGGYVSGPVILMARLLGYQTAIIEQNSVPGFTNRLLGKIVHRIFITFENTRHLFKQDRVRSFGNPVIQKRIPHRILKKDDQLSLLVCGGSQGAQFLNSKFLESIDQIKKVFPNLHIFHQTGQDDLARVREFMKDKGMKVEIAAFFDDIEEKYKEISLALSRAGAGTLTELALWGIPSILIPYPYAADDHQMKNAFFFKERGAAEVIDQSILTGELLAHAIISILSHKEKRAVMSQSALALSKPKAAQDIVRELMQMVGRNNPVIFTS